MTDKEKTIKELKEALDGLDITNKYRLNIIRAIEYIQEEPVSEEWIEELTTKLDSMSKEDFKKVFDKYAVDFNEEPVSEDLEEEIGNYVKRNGYDGLDSIEEVKCIANHFAEWQKEKDDEEKVLTYKHGFEDCKEQMMANTADAMIGLPYENKDGGYTHLIDVSRPLPVGNNKIAIIFKEEYAIKGTGSVIRSK